METKTYKEELIERISGRISTVEATAINRLLLHNNSIEYIEYDGKLWSVDDTVRLADGTTDCPLRMAWQCANTEEYFTFAEESIDVNVGAGETEEWCEAAVSDFAFFCCQSEEYFSEDAFNWVMIGYDKVCLEWHQDDLYLWDSDGEYHWEAEPDNALIPEYHHSPKPWRRNPVEAGSIGVELETWASSPADTFEFATSLGLTGEQDSSLSDEHGIEVIGKPMKFSEYSRDRNPWMRFCNESNVRCWSRSECGMHVSIDVSKCSALHIAKAIMFVHENRTFCTALAGREGNSYTRYKHGVKSKTARREAEDKHAAVSLQGSRFELRIFQANRKWEGFKRNVEFTHALISFTKSARCGRKTNELTEEQFSRWVRAVGKARRYPMLVNWLDGRANA